MIRPLPHLPALLISGLLAGVLAAGCGGSDPVDPSQRCEAGQARPCYTGPEGTQGVGACSSGFQTCDNGVWATCKGQTVPQTETCNGLDDDCNGTTDEGAETVTCGTGACQRTVLTCEGGVPQACVAGNAATKETCDGIDDTCDGVVDEGCDCVDGQSQSCFPGGAPMRNVGVCADGTQLCASGKWSTCMGAVLPGEELCNGLDDDCDGAADEGDPESNEACATGQMGACGTGVSACVSGQLQCNQTVQPGEETCNGADDDCNGVVDEADPALGEACTSNLPGVCATGAQACVNGTLQCQPDVMPSAEQCNGLDDNCDGTPDDGNPGGGAACGTGLEGACAAGQTTCTNGTVGCTQVQMPSPEQCNGIDDDCNGTVDDGNPGAGAMCTTGLQGVCATGTSGCSNGMVSCTQTTQAGPEVCGDGLDNDCDGTVDNGCSGGGSCAHPICSTGPALSSSCDPCVTQICNVDPYCCTTDWDQTCVNQVTSVCGQSCGGTSSCAHDKCVTGGALQSGCDSCVTQICNADPYCCTTQWDSVCVQQVSTVCGQTCSGSTCAHSECTAGPPLQNGCSPCVSAICSADPYCCSVDWDTVCIQQVSSVCGQTCP